MGCRSSGIGHCRGSGGGVFALYLLCLSSSTDHAELPLQVFGKSDLRVGHLFVFATFFTFTFSLPTVVWRPICRALGWFLLPLGQDALSAYVLYLFVLALAAKVKPLIGDTRFDHPTHNPLFQMAGMVMIWAIIMVRHGTTDDHEPTAHRHRKKHRALGGSAHPPGLRGPPGKEL